MATNNPLDAALKSQRIPEGVTGWTVVCNDGYYDLTLFTDRGKHSWADKSLYKAFEVALAEYHADVNCTLAEEEN